MQWVHFANMKIPLAKIHALNKQRDIVCIACKTVETLEQDNALASVAIVNVKGEVVYHAVVSNVLIVDCRTQSTGLTDDMLSGDDAVPYEAVVSDVCMILSQAILIVGHGIVADLRALGYVNMPSSVYDTEVITRKSLEDTLQDALGHVPYGQSALSDAISIMGLAKQLASTNVSTGPVLACHMCGKAKACEMFANRQLSMREPKCIECTSEMQQKLALAMCTVCQQVMPRAELSNKARRCKPCIRAVDVESVGQ